MLPIIYQGLIDRPLYDVGQLWTLQNFSRLFLDERFVAAFINTLIFSAIGTFVSTAVGVIAAVTLERLHFPFRHTLKIMFLSPLFLSALIMTFAWSTLYSPGGYITLWFRTQFGLGLPNLNTLTGMAVLAGVSAAPITYLYFSAAMTNISENLENAARTMGASGWRAVTTIVLPLLRPSLLYSLLLNFVVMLDSLAIPLIIGKPARIEVLATFLYDKSTASSGDYGIVGATAIVMLLLIQFTILLQSLLVGDIRRYTTVGGRSGGRNLIRLKPAAAWSVSAGIALYCLITSVGPGLFLILRSFCTALSPLIPLSKVLTLSNFKLVFESDAYVQSIYNTIIVAVVGGAGATVLTAVAIIVAYRSSHAIRLFVEQSAFLPRAMPGLVVGIGIFYAMVILPGGGYIRGTLLILMIAYTIRFFPTGFAAMAPAFVQLGKELELAARVTGGSELRTYRDVTIPLMRRPLLVCFLLYFVYFFKEYAAASFLFGPNTAVIGTTMLQLNLMGNSGPVSALSVIALALTLPIAIFVYARE
ncbi:ABC transporter substrate-binding protein [Sinorhizobium meliloti]|uniref:ABC transporter substrate-binding protein n=2 Tax=Rhizobium meliloti TaxID=382 RepID=A0A2J0YTZ6_RHIML|nr:ABC transporter substrate-binding protein [Sinorhizobium meliloti]